MSPLRALLALLLLACDPAAPDGPDAPGLDAPRTDSGGTDTGEIDAPLLVPDAPGDAGPLGCPALFCEDFEGDVARWTESAGYDPLNHAAVQGDVVAHGAGALRAYVHETSGGFARLIETETFPALAEGLWGRASFRTSIAVTSGHSDFIDAFAGDRSVLEIGISNGRFQLTHYPPGGGENPAGYDTDVPRDRWACMEWHFQRVSPQIEVFIDGVAVAQFARDGLEVPALTGLGLGFGNHGATDPTNEAFFDDVALGNARLGCP